MEYTSADVFAYQILDCLVTQYQYKIVNIQGNKKDIWLACETHEAYPMIRLCTTPSASAMFEKEYLTKIKSALSMVLRSNKPLLILNTHEESNGYVEDDLVQIVMTDQRISDNAILQAFPALKEALHKVEDNQKECLRLTKHLETNQMQRIKEARKIKGKDLPFVSLGIIVVGVIVALLSIAFVSGQWGDRLTSYIISGAYYKSMVVYGGEYWRLLSSGFIHQDIFDLLFYAIVLFQLGSVLEKVYKRVPFLLIFLVSLITGNLFMFIFDGNMIALGMGPALFGLLAAFFLHLWDTKAYRNRFVMMKATQIISLTFFVAILGGTSMYSLLGGFVGGFFMACVCSSSQKMKALKIHFVICGILLAGMLGYFAATIDSAYPEYSEVDQKLVEGYRHLGWNGYADRVEAQLTKAYEE